MKLNTNEDNDMAIVYREMMDIIEDPNESDVADILDKVYFLLDDYFNSDLGLD